MNMWDNLKNAYQNNVGCEILYFAAQQFIVLRASNASVERVFSKFTMM